MGFEELDPWSSSAGNSERTCSHRACAHREPGIAYYVSQDTSNHSLRRVDMHVAGREGHRDSGGRNDWLRSVCGTCWKAGVLHLALPFPQVAGVYRGVADRPVPLVLGI